MDFRSCGGAERPVSGLRSGFQKLLGDGGQDESSFVAARRCAAARAMESSVDGQCVGELACTSRFGASIGARGRPAPPRPARRQRSIMPARCGGGESSDACFRISGDRSSSRRCGFIHAGLGCRRRRARTVRKKPRTCRCRFLSWAARRPIASISIAFRISPRRYQTSWSSPRIRAYRWSPSVASAARRAPTAPKSGVGVIVDGVFLTHIGFVWLDYVDLQDVESSAVRKARCSARTPRSAQSSSIRNCRASYV